MVSEQQLLGHQERRIVLGRAPRHLPFEAGATLIELAVALVILAILLTFGMPSFSEWIQNAQIRTASETVMTGIQLARNEAVKRNTAVEFVLGNPGAQGGTGWTVREAASGTIIQQTTAGEGSRNAILTPTPGDATTITFNSLGRLPVAMLNLDGSSIITRINVDVPESVLAADKSNDMRITISTGGQIRLCDPHISATGDPRSC